MNRRTPTIFAGGQSRTVEGRSALGNGAVEVGAVPPSRSDIRYAVRYTPGTDLAARFGSEPTSLHFHTREGAEALRAACINAIHMDVVEVAAS